MEGEIGDAAGMIWQYLNEHGQTTLGKLRQGTKLSPYGRGLAGQGGQGIYCPAGSHGEGLVARRLAAGAGTDYRGRHLRFARESGTRDARDG